MPFNLSGNSSILIADFKPPKYQDDYDDYKIGLPNFETFKVITNID